MPINFPDSPTNGQVYTVGSKSWTFNTANETWDATSVTLGPQGIQGTTGTQGTQGIQGPVGLLTATAPLSYNSTTKDIALNTASSLTLSGSNLIVDSAVVPYLGNANTFSTSPQIINAAASQVGLAIRANATTPGNMQEWRNSAGTPLATVTSLGAITAVDLTLSGNLTVNGTTTTINSTVLSVDDINVELGSVTTPTDTTAAGGGITLKGAADKSILWQSTATTGNTANTGYWNLTDNLNLNGSAKAYYINGTSVLSGTTLGSGVTASSLTSFGTSPALTGTPTAPTAAAATSTTQIATTAFVTTADNLKANLASPTFTGTVNTAALTTSGALSLNYASPAITSNNASAASIFTSTVTGITIGASTIKTTGYPVAPSGTTSGTVTQSAQLNGYVGMPQNAQATSGTFTYTFAASDAGKHIYATGTPTSATFTIPANTAVAYEIGTTFVVMNDLGAATNISIAITTDTMQLAGTGTTGTRTLARYGVASITKVTSTKWIISGNGLT